MIFCNLVLKTFTFNVFVEIFPLDIITSICLIIPKIKGNIQFEYGELISSFIVGSDLFLWNHYTLETIFVTDDVKTVIHELDSSLLIIKKCGKILKCNKRTLEVFLHSSTEYLNQYLKEKNLFPIESGVMLNENLIILTTCGKIVVYNLNNVRDIYVLTSDVSDITHFVNFADNVVIVHKKDGTVHRLYERSDGEILISRIKYVHIPDIILVDKITENKDHNFHLHNTLYHLINKNGLLWLITNLRHVCSSDKVLIMNISTINCRKKVIYFLTMDGTLYKYIPDCLPVTKVLCNPVGLIPVRCNVQEIHNHKCKILITFENKVYVNQSKNLQISELKFNRK